MVACDLTSNLSAIEAIQYLCHELPVLEEDEESAVTESSHLLGRRTGTNFSDVESGSKKQYEGMTALEMAVLTDSKKVRCSDLEVSRSC